MATPVTDAPDPVRRRLEIEDRTNLHLVHPIANRLVPEFARRGIPPNAVSLAGMAFGILAGVAYHFYREVWPAVAGLVLMIGWHVMDGVDGQLARLTRTHSDFGKVLDGICDYTTFGAVYVGLALAAAGPHGVWVWTLVAASGACHAVQSAIYETQRQNYMFWGCGQESARFALPGEGARTQAGLPPHRRLADLLLRGYLHVQLAAQGMDAAAMRVLAAILARDPARAELVRQRYRDAFAPALRRWSVMSANTRTVAIFAFAVLGWPLGFFWFEIVVLSAILVALRRSQRRRMARFVTSLETVAG